MHASGKYFFWWSQTRRIARSLKTGRPVFRYDLAATISTRGALSEYARQKYWVSSIGVRVTQAKHATISGGIFPRRRTYHARGSYFPLAFNVRVNKRGVSALPPCALPTSKMRVEYYYRTCEARHTPTTNVISTIKSASEVLCWDMLRCIVLLYKSWYGQRAFSSVSTFSAVSPHDWWRDSVHPFILLWLSVRSSNLTHDCLAYHFRAPYVSLTFLLLRKYDFWKRTLHLQFTYNYPTHCVRQK